MRYVCDAPPGRTWFRIETEAEAEAESALMRHAVARHFARAQAWALQRYRPSAGIERDIGLKDHLARTMPLFLTLRADDGAGLATAMIKQKGADKDPESPAEAIIVGPANADPYPAHGDAIAKLAQHFGTALPRETCFPYRG